jgi:hypothetical protein
MTGTTPRPVFRTVALAALVPLTLVLAACGSSGSNAAAGSSPSGAARQGNGGAFGQGGGGFGGGGFPGANGLIAAVSPGTLQVQSTDSQTTVTYGRSTRFTEVVDATVVPGDCVVVTGTPVSGNTTALTATSVRVETKVNGSCPTATVRGPGGGSGGGQGFGGQGGNGQQSGSPRARPSGAPSGGFGGRDLAFAIGSVTAVAGGTVTVQGVLREPRTSAGASPQPTTPTSLTVTIASGTPVTKTVATTSKAAVVGMCAAAIGKANDRGDVAATSITVSKPDPSNGCRSAGGFGFIGGGRGNGSGSGSGSGTGGGSGSSA